MRADIRNELQGHLLAGRYRLDRVLAAGGMAEVWQATDLVLARRVAVKMLRPHLSADPAFVRRFRREALAAARLNHPCIVAIFDSCTDGDIEAIVMELVEGPTLRQRLDEGPVDAHVAVGIGAQVAAALDAAHAAGIIHRDIKPANILLCRADHSNESQSSVPRLMVTDFGIAKALLTDGTEAPDATDLTRAGAMLGTAKYLAPEQVRGGPVDARTDVYALGVVLYEALCGRPPFAAESDLATALARLNTEPLLPRQVRSDIRRDVEAVVLRAMAREPAARYGSAAELRAALLSVDPGPGAASRLVDPTDPAPDQFPTFVQSERSWLVPTALIALLAAALITTGVLLGRTDTGRNFVDRALVAVGARDSGATTTTAAAEPRLLGPLTATAFDPEGDRRENDDLAAKAVDGDPATIWRTECYANVFAKAGVGLVVETAEAGDLSRLEIDANAAGWHASVFVADAPKTSLADWGEPVASQDGGQSTAIDLGGHNGRAVLLWVTSVEGIPADNCFGQRPNSHRLEVSEVRLFGR